MDLYTKKQKQINRIKTRTLEQYPAIWTKIINQWKKPGLQDRAWLTFSANYLFRTKNVRWAIDPFTINARLSSSINLDFPRDLSNLSLVLLTHSHADHMDIGLIHALRESSIHWVVPSSILDKMIKAGVNTDLITVSQALVQIKFESISITPFDGLHFHKNKDGDLLGVPAKGYLVEQGRKRWLFPGDTRTYQPELLPSFGPVDAVFAHLWLGRASALENQAWQIDEFCQFHLAFKPKRIVITHLRELGRDAKDFWDVSHAKLVKSRFKDLSPETDISIALTGQWFDI